MVYQVKEITKDVRVSLDQNGIDEVLAGLGDFETLTLDDLIASKVEDAAEMVEKSAPTHMLEGFRAFGGGVYWGDQCSGWVLLPDDFMRLISFEMSDWERGVSEVIGVDSAKYGLQRQRNKALRGTSQRPVCAIVARAEGLALEFYSCKSEGAHISRALYLPRPRIDSYGGIEISERCYRAVVYATASMVAEVLGEKDRSTELIEMTKGMIG